MALQYVTGHWDTAKPSVVLRLTPVGASAATSGDDTKRWEKELVGDAPSGPTSGIATGSPDASAEGILAPAAGHCAQAELLEGGWTMQ